MELSWEEDAIAPCAANAEKPCAHGKPGSGSNHKPKLVAHEVRHDDARVTFLKPGAGPIRFSRLRLHPVEAKHLCSCKVASCAACAVIKSGGRWRRRTRVKGEDSWLLCKWIGTTLLGIGCALCKAASVNTAYGRCDVEPESARVCNLLRHMEESRPHIDALDKHMGLPESP